MALNAIKRMQNYIEVLEKEVKELKEQLKLVKAPEAPLNQNIKTNDQGTGKII